MEEAERGGNEDNSDIGMWDLHLLQTHLVNSMKSALPRGFTVQFSEEDSQDKGQQSVKDRGESVPSASVFDNSINILDES